MKANKALKRLARIESLISDVTERYSASVPSMREVLQDAKDAVTRAKEAVSLQISSGTATNPPLKSSDSISKSTPGPPEARKKLVADGTPVKKGAPGKATVKKRW